MVTNFLRNHFWKFVVFGLVGFSAFLIDWLFFNLFYGLHLGFLTSRISSAVLSMIFNFSVNRNITFKAKHTPAKKQMIRWLIVYAIAIGINIGTGKLVLMGLGESVLNANIAFLLGIIVSIPFSFLGSLWWVFRKRTQ